MRLTNKTILITGGASGIGFEAAKQFLALGNKVIITGRNSAKIEEARRLLPSIIAIPGDVAKQEDNLELYRQIELLGGIDMLYNNAGVGTPPLNLGMPDPNHFAGASHEMEINYLSVIRLNSLFLPMLSSKQDAAIITTTSILSIVPSSLEGTYSASKAALSSYTKSFRSDLKAIGSTVKVFELVPPLVDTPMVANRNDKKISTGNLVKHLIEGLRKDQETIRVGDTKIIYWLNRLMPKVAYRLINPNTEKANREQKKQKI